MFGVEAVFWLRLVLVLAIVFFLWISFNTLMRKWLKVERKKLLSFDHVNEKHQKIDSIIRITTFAILLLGYGINSARPHTNVYGFLQPWSILMCFVVVSELSRAVMKRKYAQNPNAYKVTIGDTLIIILLYFTLLTTDFWGLV
ncbi:DUF4181 domain-containing protein [Thalassobacillus sp. CUG 92003]|uniref:DUF4181 domain-containing protein n=1 Tax=Thalassobacillus sp. CUG 92003 TaxID=2736641 RepID=UPI0015E647CE|nr:DUF4181 domain-containing protein [Thalassobacillus sp. CUG 92003]